MTDALPITITVPGYTGPERRRQAHDLSESEFGRIVDAVSEGDRLRAMDSRFDSIERALDVGDARMRRIEDKLDGNSAVTGEVRDLLDGGKAFFRFASGFGRLARWVGGIAGAAAAVWALIYTATHGGKPPG